jgi:hypothetical protein
LTLRNLNLWRGRNPGYRDLMGRMIRRVLGLWVACAAVLLAPPIASAAPPSGTADGWRSPAIGEQELTVRATPGDGPALRSATLTLGGVLLYVEPFADGTCTVTCPATTKLRMNTKRVPDGNRELVITVEDVNGVDHTIFTQTLLVDNAPRPTPCPRKTIFDPCAITVSVGSGRISLPQPSPPGPVGPGSTDPSCRAPRLAMRLAQRPLRFRRGVPVLLRNRVYRFSGRLTCRINGVRRGAPRGMAVQVRHRLRARWTVAKPDIHVRKAGEVVARLAFRSRRVVIFRVRGTGGDLVRVRIPVRVVRRR